MGPFFGKFALFASDLEVAINRAEVASVSATKDAGKFAVLLTNGETHNVQAASVNEVLTRLQSGWV